MRGPWLDGVAGGALLALVAASMPALEATAQTSVEASIPVPEPANVPPPTIADLDPPSTPPAAAAEAAANASAPPAASTIPGASEQRPVAAAALPDEAVPGAEVPAGDATPVITATIAPEPVAPPPGKVEAASPAVAVPAMDEDAVVRSVPVPEPANVPPPTAQDIGTPPLAPADLAVAEKLREFVTTRVDRFIEGKKERAAVEDFYKNRSYAPAWVEYGAPSKRMEAAIARLKAADADGLDANDYATPDLKGMANDPESVAQAELKLTNSVLAFARHAQSGRVVAARISTNIEVTQPVPEPADILKVLAAAKDVPAALDGYNPPHEGFKRLQAKLAELRGGPEDKTVQIPSGPLLRPKGKKGKAVEDSRVPLLRERLKVEGDPADQSYDDAIIEAVRAFQRSKGLSANGVLNQATVDALNGRSHGRDINTVVSNMERWRWLPRDLGQSYVMVNIPDFTLKVVRGNTTAFHTRIVVGKPNTPSPVFSDEIETIQLNPTWHVPQSIIYGEYLPALQQDPSVLARMGLVMERNRDGTISIRQPPGERNALGRIKFNFPNRFQVYLHDTPQKHLFAHERRAYSHGCMRVQNPDQFGEVLASIALPQEGYTAQRFTRMYGGSEQWIRFKRFVPVHLVYMNTYVDDHGKLVVRDDVYGYDQRVQSALNGKYVVVAERSQRVTAGQARRQAQNNRVVQQAQRERPQSPGFFLFPFFR